MTEENEMRKDSDWKKFVRKHWGAVAIFAVTIVLAAAGAVYVLSWFTGHAQSTGLVPSILDAWTMGNVINFILHLIFWELILIGIPVAIGAIIAWQWWKRLPAEEREYRIFGRGSRSRDAGGAISTLLFIAFAIKVYFDGNWNVPMSTWTVDYVVGSMITILIWIAAIFAIPATIGIVWWISRELGKKP
jgi:hypothetical protein